MKDSIITEYLIGDYQKVTRILRNQKDPDRVNLINLIDKECKDLNRYDGKAVYRVDFLENCDFAFNFFKLNLGKVVCFPSILSTYRKISDFPILEKNLEFYIKFILCFETTAIDAMEISNSIKTENEVFFMPNTCFLIDSIFNNQIVLKECKETPYIIFFNGVGPYQRQKSKTETKASLSDQNII